MIDDGPREVMSTLGVSEHDGGMAMFQPATGDVFACNSVGARIWSGLAKGLSVSAISNEIADGFGVSPERALQDTRCFVSDLERYGLLVRMPGKS